jgi:hypothetical protein
VRARLQAEQFAFTVTGIKTMSNPLIQIDDEIREMTDDEYAAYQEQQANAPTITTAQND